MAKKTTPEKPPIKSTPEKPPTKSEATVAAKALRTGKATPAQIRSMGGRIESELAAAAKGNKGKKKR
jgi:hypothetical protein